MKDSVKKFFLLGLGIAAAGVAVGLAVKNKDKIKKSVDELVSKKHIIKEDAEKLKQELIFEVEKLEKSVAKKFKK
jgi:polyhydroxyalkanoate synthesis regulator phasin